MAIAQNHLLKSDKFRTLVGLKELTVKDAHTEVTASLLTLAEYEEKLPERRGYIKAAREAGSRVIPSTPRAPEEPAIHGELAHTSFFAARREPRTLQDVISCLSLQPK